MAKLRKQLIWLVYHKTPINSLLEEFLWTHGSLKDEEQAWRVYCEKDTFLLWEDTLKDEEQALRIYCERDTFLLCEDALSGQSICVVWVTRVARLNWVVSGKTNGDRKGSALRYEACSDQEPMYVNHFPLLPRTNETTLYAWCDKRRSWLDCQVCWIFVLFHPNWSSKIILWTSERPTHELGDSVLQITIIGAPTE